MNRTRKTLTMGATLAVLGLAGSADRAAATIAQERGPLVCFPAGKWAPAPDRERPCAFLYTGRGGLRVQVQDADGDVRYSARVGARRGRIVLIWEDGSVRVRTPGGLVGIGARDR